jgi:hypothetical protein
MTMVMVIMIITMMPIDHRTTTKSAPGLRAHPPPSPPSGGPPPCHPPRRDPRGVGVSGPNARPAVGVVLTVPARHAAPINRHRGWGRGHFRAAFGQRC